MDGLWRVIGAAARRRAPDPGPAGPGTNGANLYLDLLKKCLTRSAFPTTCHPLLAVPPEHQAWLDSIGCQVVVAAPPDPEARREGRDWPADAETMIGLVRLEHLERCVADVLERGVPGDLIETGVWRGGASILMRAVLAVHGVTDRTVWVADSFRGLPKVEPGPDGPLPADDLWMYPNLAVSLDVVKANFDRYGLLDDQVRFLEGWFADTLPSAPIQRLAVVRLDGDLYSSTWEALSALYPKLSVGGHLIVDDWSIPQCRQAVMDYRDQFGIDEPVEEIDWTGVFWRRER